MRKRSWITVLRNDPLLAAAGGLAVLTAGVFAYQRLQTPPAPLVVEAYRPLPVHAALTRTPDAPVVRNTACGPEKTFRNVTFDCAGARPLGVQISNVFLRFADARTGEGDMVCAQGRNQCRPVSTLNEDEQAGFDWWRGEAFSRYRP